MAFSPSLRTLGRGIAWLAVLSIALQVRDIAAGLGMPIPRFPFAYGGAILDNLLGVALVLLAAACLHPVAMAAGVAQLGLRWRGARGPLLTLLATLPCWLGLWTQAHSVGIEDLRGFLLLALLFPFAEELIFRGFGFVFACRSLRWRAWVPALLQALVFGGVHWLGAGGGGGEALLIFAITFVGALAFAIVDAQDGYSIWSGWVLHASLNAAWMVFAVSDSAASGWIGIALRLGAVLLAMLLLHWGMAPARETRRRDGARPRPPA